MLGLIRRIAIRKDCCHRGHGRSCVLLRRSHSMFLIRPAPVAGESLSSWRQRSGLANGFRMFPVSEPYRWRRDPDCFPVESEARWLESEFGLSAAQTMPLSLDAFRGRVFDGFVRGSEAHWFSPLAGGQGRSMSGPMFCPACLGRDPIPHFRVSWRFSFLTHCPAHHCRLHDRCAKCSAFVWPAALRRNTQEATAWFEMGHCPFCGYRLSDAEVATDGRSDLSDRCWGAAVTGKSPSFQAADALLYFDGLRAMCQLLLRRGGASLWTAVPAESGGLAKPSFESAVLAIEQVAIADRIEVLEAAAWLMDDWPERFVTVARKCGLSAENFSGRYHQLPPWFSTAVKTHLARRNRYVTPEQVQSAICACAAHGGPVSKSAVRRWLGVAESKAIDQVLGQRRRATPEECIRLVDEFEQRLEHSSPARCERATLARDYLIVLLSMLNGEQVETICAMEYATVERGIRSLVGAGRENTQQDVRALISRARELQAFYAQEIRKRFTKASGRGTTWFLSRFGDPLQAHHLRQRVSNMMVGTFDANLWKSVEVFAGGLFVAQTRGT